MKRNTTSIVFSFTLAATAALGLATSSSALAAPSAVSSAPPIVVTIKNFVFTPNIVRIPVGGSVTWKNLDQAAHTVADTSARSFDSGSLATGKTFTFTFDKPGAYKYICAFHPSMVATILVGPDATPGPSAPDSSDDSEGGDRHR